jgi:hypothetical protein
MTDTSYRCPTCRYSHENGATTNCFGVVGSCGSMDGYRKWEPLEPDNDGFDPEPYLNIPSVMPEEKPYMSFEEVI